jgi:hypothetical protein
VDAADFAAAVFLLIPRLIGWQTLARAPKEQD